MAEPVDASPETSARGADAAAGAGAGSPLTRQETTATTREAVPAGTRVNKSGLAARYQNSDGYRWHKYGEKTIKGNPFPRSYYKCSFPGCGVKKFLEPSADDPKVIVTTYQSSEHTHPKPVDASPSKRGTAKKTHARVGACRLEEGSLHARAVASLVERIFHRVAPSGSGGARESTDGSPQSSGRPTAEDVPPSTNANANVSRRPLSSKVSWLVDFSSSDFSDMSSLTQEFMPESSNWVDVPFHVKLGEDLVLTVTSLGNLEATSLFSDFYGERQVFAPVGYRAELVDPEGRFCAMRVELGVSGEVRYVVRVERTEAAARDSLVPQTFFDGPSAAIAWAKACVSERSARMASLSGMKAFGFLEELVLDALAAQLSPREIDSEQQRGFWEQMLVCRRRKGKIRRAKAKGNKRKGWMTSPKAPPTPVPASAAEFADASHAVTLPREHRLKLVEPVAMEEEEVPRPQKNRPFADRRPEEKRRRKSIKVMIYRNAAAQECK